MKKGIFFLTFSLLPLFNSSLSISEEINPYKNYLSSHYKSLIDYYENQKKDAYSLQNLAILYRLQGNHEKSADCWRKTIGIKNDPINIEGLVWSYLLNKQPEKAISFLLSQNQESLNPQTLLALGWAYLFTKEYIEAEKALKKCAESRHYSASANVLLGRVYKAQGKTKEADDAFKEAKKADYALSEVDYERAKLKEQEGNINDAWGLYSKLTQVDSKWKEMAQKRDELRPLITKKPEEISPTKKIQTPTVTEPLATPLGSILKIGLHTNSKGKPIPVPEVSFKVGSPFIIKGKESGKTIAKGFENEEWLIKADGDRIQISNSVNKNLIWTKETTVVQSTSSNSTIVLHELLHASGYAWARKQDQEYREKIEVTLKNGGLRFTNIVHSENYLLSVLPSEMISWWPDEALKCQAVISRTNAFFKAKLEKRHKDDGYDLCDSQHCQVYVGANVETKKAKKAVESTAGEILKYKGRVIHALFSSNCGGYVQGSGELLGWGHEPYLLTVPDNKPNQKLPDSPLTFDRWLKEVPLIYCGPSNETYFAESRWVRIITKDIITERVNREKTIGKVKSIIILSRSPSGHIKKLKIQGEKDILIIEKEHKIRGILAPGLLRSTLFLVDYVSDGNGSGDFIFWGGGWVYPSPLSRPVSD